MSKETDLLNFCEEQTTIKCSMCKKKDVTNAGAEESVDTLYELGWRKVGKVCLCGSCEQKGRK